MSWRQSSLRLGASALALAALTWSAALAAPSPDSGALGRDTPYQQTNLVSDLPGMAPVVDPDLVNPWGIAFTPTSPFWISDNGTGLSTLYNGSGQKQSLVVTIPPPGGSPAGTTATPTGVVFNGGTSFVVSQNGLSGAARFLFATEDGTISGWAPNVNSTAAILAVDNSTASAVYKALAIATSNGAAMLYAANFRAATIDVFDSAFAPVTTAGGFVDSQLPAGFAPFDIKLINGQLYVTYAMQDAAKHDDVPGAGLGYVDVFTTDGPLVRRLASQGPLNAPWGLALAPAGFGAFSNDLLVGNFGDGRISAFDLNTGQFRGQLKDASHQPISIDGLWGLTFGNGGQAGSTRTLFFTAGIQGEAHGLFGSLTKGGGASDR